MDSLEIELVAEEPVDELVELSEVAEEEGFEGIWITDHYNNRNPIVALTAIARATDEIGIGTGITNPYYAHPAWTASAMATLDEMSDGRVRFGLGPGDPNTLKALDVERESPLYEVLDAVKLSRGLFRGESMDVDGLANGAKLNYDSRDIPVYIGAQGPNMLRMAADHGDGILINASHPDDFEWSLEQIGETDAEIVAYTSFSVDEDPEKAAEAARQPVSFVASASPPPVLDRHDIDKEIADEIGEKIEEGEFSEAFSLVTPNMLDSFSVHGTPDDCRKQVDELFEVGVDTVVVGSPLGSDPESAIRLAADALD
ncbi:5,10-methylenetetrahydromethanopterin reductase [Halorutilales archaeon Cl-col2-1]